MSNLSGNFVFGGLCAFVAVAYAYVALQAEPTVNATLTAPKQPDTGYVPKDTDLFAYQGVNAEQYIFTVVNKNNKGQTLVGHPAYDEVKDVMKRTKVETTHTYLYWQVQGLKFSKKSNER